MLILHTAHTYAPELNGVAEVVRHISKRLVRSGHEVHVATSRPKGTAAQETIDGVHVHRFDVQGHAVNGIYGESQAYLEFIRSLPWHAVALHYAPIWSTDLLLPRLRSLRAGRVFVGHGLSVYRHPKYQAYLADVGRYLQDVEQVVSLSPLLEETDFCRRHNLSPPVIIPNGVDPRAWQVPLQGLRDRWRIGQRPWLLSVSNHSPVKEHGVFFEVLKRVRQRYADVCGTIIGNSYPAACWRLGRFGLQGGCWYRCRLRSLAWPGLLRPHVARADVVSAIREADVVLVTSRREASPIVMLESMAAGRPWVSFDVGCVRENAGGVVVGSGAEMAETVCSLLAEPWLRAELGAQGQTRVTEKHDWDKLAARYEAVYHEACRLRNASQANELTATVVQ